MAEEIQSTEDTSSENSTQAPEPSLEQLASQFTPPATETQQVAPVQNAPAAPVAAPDPALDPDGFAKFHAEQNAATQQQVQELNARLEQDAANKQVEVVERDIKAAVDTISGEVEGAIPEMVEGLLHYKYARDANFKKIFDNRDQNPAAFQKAVAIVGKEYRDKAAIKIDPQVAENQRALQASINSQTTGNNASADAEWKGLSQGEFKHKWQQLVNSQGA